MGSILGVHMVKARPDLFYAFVGTGQVAGDELYSGLWRTVEEGGSVKDEGAIR